MKTILCCEAGFECDYVVKNQTEEEDIKKWLRTRHEKNMV